jgi:plasmid maintenance system antidote protein VapI
MRLYFEKKASPIKKDMMIKLKILFGTGTKNWTKVKNTHFIASKFHFETFE